MLSRQSVERWKIQIGVGWWGREGVVGVKGQSAFIVLVGDNDNKMPLYLIATLCVYRHCKRFSCLDVHKRSLFTFRRNSFFLFFLCVTHIQCVFVRIPLNGRKRSGSSTIENGWNNNKKNRGICQTIACPILLISGLKWGLFSWRSRTRIFFPLSFPKSFEEFRWNVIMKWDLSFYHFIFGYTSTDCTLVVVPELFSIET